MAASNRGHRRASIARRRKGKKMQPPRPSGRLPEGVRAHYDEKGGFQMGSSVRGSSRCSKMGVDHWMLPNQTDGYYYYCANPGCLANC